MDKLLSMTAAERALEWKKQQNEALIRHFLVWYADYRGYAKALATHIQGETYEIQPFDPGERHGQASWYTLTEMRDCLIQSIFGGTIKPH